MFTDTEAVKMSVTTNTVNNLSHDYFNLDDQRSPTGTKFEIFFMVLQSLKTLTHKTWHTNDIYKVLAVHQHWIFLIPSLLKSIYL